MSVVLVSVGAWSRSHLRDAGCYLCLRMVHAWICRREVAGQALKGTGRGIETSAVLVQLYPCYWVYGKVHTNVASMHCVFPSLLLTAGWDQTGPVVCPFQFARLDFATSGVSQWPEGTFFPAARDIAM